MGEPAQTEKLWRYEPTDGKFHCKYPDCTYSHHDPGGVNLHHYKKHGPATGRTTTPASTSRKADQPNVRTMQKPAQKSPLTHDWRLLNRRNPAEAAAIDQGFREVCTDCEELR